MTVADALAVMKQPHRLGILRRIGADLGIDVEPHSWPRQPCFIPRFDFFGLDVNALVERTGAVRLHVAFGDHVSRNQHLLAATQPERRITRWRALNLDRQRTGSEDRAEGQNRTCRDPLFLVYEVNRRKQENRGGYDPPTCGAPNASSDPKP